MQEQTKLNLLLIPGVIVLILGAVFAGCFGLIFDSILNKMLVISPDGKSFDSFVSPPVDVFMDFYMFNVTNPSEVQHYGAKPILKELGPYSYQEIMVKYDFTWDDNDGTVEYFQNTTYVFRPDRSRGSENDTITTLNAIMVLVGALGYDNKIIKEIVWPEIEAQTDLFQEFTIGQLLFEGFDMPLFNFDFSFLPRFAWTEGLSGSLYDILLKQGKDVSALEENKISFFYGANGTNDGRYRVKTGAAGMDDYLSIEEWKNDTQLHYWNDPFCDMINGTDGTQFPPGVTKDQTLRLYTSDLCRSLYLLYETDKKVQDAVDTYHFTPPKEMLASPNNNSENACYCVRVPGDELCLGDSMLNMAPCIGGAPVVLSTPHFYQGDEQDVDNVIGLNPQKELHETYLDVEPRSGVVMEANKRIQMNLPLRKYGKLPSFQNVPELMFPIFWASENAEISKEDADQFERVLTLPFIVVYSICGLLILVGCILIASYSIRKRNNKKQHKNEALLKK